MKKYMIIQVRYTDMNGMKHKADIDLTVSNMESIETLRKDCTKLYNAANVRFTYEGREEEGWIKFS